MTMLAGKTAVVTGASRGIGRAVALVLASRGAQVIVHYDCAQSEADAIVKEINRNGGRARGICADLSTMEGTCALARQAQAIIGARLDILVASADMAIAAPIDALTVEEFDCMFAANVRAPYFLVQKLLPTMCKGSSIVFTSSLAARTVLDDLSAYAATKGAIDTLIRHFAADLGRKGIRINAVAPGLMDSQSNSETNADDVQMLSMQALQRWAEPKDIAGAVAFLASDGARSMTGVTLRVDGGAKL